MTPTYETTDSRKNRSDLQVVAAARFMAISGDFPNLDATCAQFCRPNLGAETMIAIRKVKEPHGCWGEYAPYPVEYEGKKYRTTEALFQALRFDDEEIKEAIRADKSPMVTKWISTKHRREMVVEPASERDLNNMRMCLRLKIEQHPELVDELLGTGEEEIVEDCTKRQRGHALDWGAAQQEDGTWKGQNRLGTLWMERRNKLRSGDLETLG